MKTDSFIRVLAGALVLVSVGLAYFFGPGWLWFTCFIAVNLIQSAFTGFCPPAWLARKAGLVKDDETRQTGETGPSPRRS